MAFQLTRYDSLTLGEIRMKIQGEPVSGFPDGNNTIEFQFPPKIVTDGKTTKWHTSWADYAWEPVKHWKGNGARAITLKAEYVVTGDTWNIDKISKMMKRYKSYFYSTIKGGVLPVFEIKMYRQAPESGRDPAFRGMSIDIRPGEEYIVQNDQRYPLYTEVSLNLELVTNIEKEDGSKFKFKLPNKPPQEWY